MEDRSRAQPPPLPPPKTCRYPECTNPVSGGTDLFCQEAHAQENDDGGSAGVTLVPELAAARVMIARPKYMRFLKAEADKKFFENLTGYPQLPDPAVPNSRLPPEYEQKLAAEEVKFSRETEHTPDAQPSLDLQLLRKMKEAYTRARKTQEQDLVVLVRRERINLFCREELAPVEALLPHPKENGDET